MSRLGRWLARQPRSARVGLAAGLGVAALLAGYVGWAEVRTENRFPAAEPKLREAVEAAPDHPDADLIREVLVPGYMARFQMVEAHELLVPWVERRPRDLRLRLWL